MAFCDLLRLTVLLAAGAATALAAITVVSASAADDTLTIYVAAVWWIAALIGGIVLGRPSRAAEAMRPALTEARMATALPSLENPTRAALARLWPLAAFAAIAGGVGLVFAGVAAVGTGFAIGAAMALRSREGAVAAIEERDGVRFYVEPGSALEPVKLVRTPGLRRDRPAATAASGRINRSPSTYAGRLLSAAPDGEAVCRLLRGRRHGVGCFRVGHLDVRPAVAGPDQDQRGDESKRRYHGATQECALESLGESVRHGRVTSRHHVVRARGGDRGQNRQAQRSADLLRGVDQAAGEALLALIDAGDRRDRRGDEPEPESKRGE
jgi:hypothetical protein